MPYYSPPVEAAFLAVPPIQFLDDSDRSSLPQLPGFCPCTLPAGVSAGKGTLDEVKSIAMNLAVLRHSLTPTALFAQLLSTPGS
mmetsp:Transcript_3427/g.6967  ORF Transcript_3427/g.6967 Transcript_3427/m.6967 type:complete len:84 (-) Transcript_3427:461-712(-)